MEPTLDWSSAMPERGIAVPLTGAGHAVAMSGIPDAPVSLAGAGTNSGVLKSVLMCSVLVGIITAMVIPTTSFEGAL